MTDSQRAVLAAVSQAEQRLIEARHIAKANNAEPDVIEDIFHVFCRTSGLKADLLALWGG